MLKDKLNKLVSENINNLTKDEEEVDPIIVKVIKGELN